MNTFLSVFFFLIIESCSFLKPDEHKMLKMKCDIFHFIDGKEFAFELGDTLKSWGVQYIPLDCDGNIKVLDYYPSGELISETFYKGEKVSKKMNIVDPETHALSEREFYYFKRIPFGQWTYYYKNGEIWREIDFSN